MNQLFSSKV